MSVIWWVLGLVLITLVVGVLVGFFVYRPRAQKRVTAATQAIAAELHGRPAEMIAPAQCRDAEIRDPGSVKGLGVLAMTDQAVLFCAGERVVILARDGLTASAAGTTLQLRATTPAAQLTLTTPDADVWAQRLAS